MERSVVIESVRSGKLPRSFEETWPREAEFIRSCVARNLFDRPSAADILAMELWAPESPSPITPVQSTSLAGAQQQPQQQFRSALPISSVAGHQDMVCLPRKEVEEMRQRITDLEATIEALNLRLQHYHQQQPQRWPPSGVQPMVAMPPARGDSTAVMHVSPLSLSLGGFHGTSSAAVELGHDSTAAFV